MHIQQLYTACLSEAAYYVESNGEAAIIDPLRDIGEYIELAKKRNATIKYIFETHFHADFVSGHLDLAEQTGAPIIFGPGAKTKFKAHNATDGEKFSVGDTTIEVIHTPGHTLESSCFLLRDGQQEPQALFTGDTLFVGDVGRPDLSSGDMSAEELAGIMYDTLQQKIMPLADHIKVYPAHGAGSNCGKNLGPETFSTIGEEKKQNYALQPQSKEEFVKAVTSGLHIAPKYFALNAQINQEGYETITKVIKNAMQPLTVADLKARLKEDIVLLDTRPATVFSQGFVPGSVFIGLEGRFAEWAGSLLSYEKPIILLTDAGKEEETAIRLSRVGFSRMEGFLYGGFKSWQAAGEKIDMLIDVEADELAMDIPHDPNLVVVDVRKEAEFADGHVENALNLPLVDMTDVAMLAQFEDNQNLYVHCAGGYRSVIASSLLKRQGIHNLRNVTGGWASIKEQEKIKTVKEASVLN